MVRFCLSLVLISALTACTYTNDAGDTVTVNFSEIENIIGLPDYIVEGTDAGDLIDWNYTDDPHGDMIDNDDGNPNSPGVGDNDSILAGAGNDSVIAGSGDDTIYGGSGDDVIEGDGVGNQAGTGLSQEFYDSTQTMDGSSIMDLPTWSFNFGNYTGNPFDAIGSATAMTNPIQTEVDMITTPEGYIGKQWGQIQINDQPVDYLGNSSNPQFVFLQTYLESVTFADGTTLDEIELRNFSVQLYQDLGYSNATTANTPIITTMFHEDDNGDFIVTYLPHDGLGSDVNLATLINPQGTLILAALEREYGEIVTHTIDDGGQNAIMYTDRGNVYSGLGDTNYDAPVVVPGNDFIDGGEGADVIFGNEGSDTIALTDSFGNDTIEGGEDDGDSDVDVLDISGLTSGAAVDLSANGASDVESGTVTVGGDTATFSEIENIAFTDNGDTVTGSGGDDDLDLGAGDDIVDAGDGDDTIDGGDGDDSIDGGAGSDSLTGGEGSDTIDGGEGADTIDGGEGDDDLVAGGGDSVTGGAGDDEFTIDSSVSDTGDITIVGGETDEEGSVDPTNNPDGQVGDILDLNGLDDVVVTFLIRRIQLGMVRHRKAGL